MVDLAETNSTAAAQRLTEANASSLRNICATLGIGMVLITFSLLYLSRIIRRKLNGVIAQLQAETGSIDRTGASLQEAKRVVVARRFLIGGFYRADQRVIASTHGYDRVKLQFR
jgi:hypothetical protein